MSAPFAVSSMALRDYANGKTELSRDPKVWRKLTDWQRLGLIKITPVNRDVARIELTDQGRKEMKK